MSRGEHVKVLDDLLLLLLATALRRRPLEAKRKHPDRVAHRGHADNQHQQILGIAALGAEDNRARLTNGKSIIRKETASSANTIRPSSHATAYRPRCRHMRARSASSF